MLDILHRCWGADDATGCEKILHHVQARALACYAGIPIQTWLWPALGIKLSAAPSSLWPPTIILPDKLAEEVSREGEVATTSHVRPAGKEGVSALRCLSSVGLCC